MDYGIEHEGKVYTPNGTNVRPDDNAKRNAEIERAELKEWRTKPDRWAGYVVKGRFTTWLGTDIGRVEVTSHWSQWSRHLGLCTMTAIRVHGTNGAVYHGRYGSDWAQLCRVRRYK